MLVKTCFDAVRKVCVKQTDRRGRRSLHYICLYYEFLPYNINIFTPPPSLLCKPTSPYTGEAI